MRRVVEVRALLDGRGEGGFSNGIEYIKRICAGRFCVCCQRRSRQIGAEVAENVEIDAEERLSIENRPGDRVFGVGLFHCDTKRACIGVFVAVRKWGIVGGAEQIVAEKLGFFVENQWKFDIKSTNKMFDDVEINRVVDGGFGVVGGANCRQRSRRQIVAENPASVANRHEIGDFGVNPFVFDPRRRSSGHYVEVRTLGVIGSVRQIVAEKLVLLLGTGRKSGIATQMCSL